MNFALITLDSVRWDQFQRASTPFFDALGQPSEARAHADSTFPSHMQLLAGNLHVPVGELAKEYFRFPWMPATFKEDGYTTIAAASLPWVSKRFMGRHFDHFFYEPFAEKLGMAKLPHSLEQIDEVLAEDKNFVFLNVGETHFPYTKDMLAPWDDWAPRMAFQPQSISPEDGNRMMVEQASTVAWVDRVLGEWFGSLSGEWVIYITADHGELFGEHGLWLHGHGCHQEETSVPVVCSDWEWLKRR